MTQLDIMSDSCLAVNRNGSSEYKLLQDISEAPPTDYFEIPRIYKILWPLYDFVFDFSTKKTDSLNLVVDIKSYRLEVDVRATLSIMIISFINQVNKMIQ